VAARHQDPRQGRADAAPSATDSAEQQEQQDQRADEPEDRAHRISALALALHLRDFRRQRLVGDARVDRDDAVEQAFVELARAEARRDLLADDAPGLRVRQVTFEARADLDAQLALRDRDAQHDAVVLVLCADLPLSAELERDAFDRLPTEVGQHDDGDLVRRVAAQALEQALELAFVGRAQDTGPVGHPTVIARQLVFLRACEGTERPEEQRGEAEPARARSALTARSLRAKSTFGTTCSSRAP
jgi:hypothetical protein